MVNNYWKVDFIKLIETSKMSLSEESPIFEDLLSSSILEKVNKQNENWRLFTRNSMIFYMWGHQFMYYTLSKQHILTEEILLLEFKIQKTAIGKLMKLTSQEFHQSQINFLISNSQI